MVLEKQIWNVQKFFVPDSVFFFCPLLNSWEPFLPQLPSYGNYGPLCWFRLELTDNCTYNTLNEHYLQSVPVAVVCFGCSMLTFTVLLILCGMYCKFCMTTIGGHIVRVIPTAVVLVILPIVMMVWFIRSAVYSDGFGSFSAWLRNVTGIRAANFVLLTAIGIYVHFPTHKCEQCRRSPYLSTDQSELQPLLPQERNISLLKQDLAIHIQQSLQSLFHWCHMPSKSTNTMIVVTQVSALHILQSQQCLHLWFLNVDPPNDHKFYQLLWTI